MKKSVIYTGLGIVVAALLVFMLRLITSAFFQDNMKLLFLLGGLSLLVVVVGAIVKGWRKSLVWLGVGGLIAELAEFLIRLTGFQDNVTLFVVTLIAGLAVLIVGVVKKGG